MKKLRLLLSIFSLALIFFLSSCVRPQIIPVGNRPTKKFTVVDYLQDDAIFEAKSELKLYGNSEFGVVIVATLYDSKGNVIDQNYAYTSDNNEWQLSLKAPDASMKVYTLKIADAAEIFHEVFVNIRFGEVWLYLGDNLNNFSLDDYTSDTSFATHEDDVIDYNKMFYYNNKWAFASRNKSNMGYTLLDNIDKNLSSHNKKPLAIVFASEEQTNIYNWLSRDLISSRKVIKDFLIANDLYKETDEVLSTNDMAYLYEKYLLTLSGMTYTNVIINQGQWDLEASNDESLYVDKPFSYIYSQMLYNFFDLLENEFTIKEKVLVLQESSDFTSNSHVLREVQARICNYFNHFVIVPTYDINIVGDNQMKIVSKDDLASLDNFDDLTIIGLDYEKLAQKLLLMIEENYEAPTLSSVVKEYDSTSDQVIMVKLIFSNINKFDKIEKINGLKFYDEDGNLLDLDYTIVNNEIIINLEVKTDDMIEASSIDSMPNKSYFKLSKISYGYDSFIYDNNLSANNIVAIPFIYLM